MRVLIVLTVVLVVMAAAKTGYKPFPTSATPVVNSTINRGASLP